VKAAFPDLPARARHTLRRLLHSGRPAMSAVATELGLHPRTLRRRLAEGGTDFGTLRDEVLFAVAREYLEMSDLPVGEVGALVGFASPGTFSESFRRWGGVTPSAWRAARRGTV
jgi:AraC-like DNA-binding protein